MREDHNACRATTSNAAHMSGPPSRAPRAALRRALSTQPTLPDVPHPRSNPPPGRPRIALIVEDDDAVAILLTDIVRLRGYSVRRAATLAEASLRASLELPTVALVDLVLLDGSTEDIVRSLHAKSVPVLLLSGSTYAEEVAAELGAPLLMKPFHLDVLLDRLSELEAMNERSSDLSQPPG